MINSPLRVHTAPAKAMLYIGMVVATCCLGSKEAYTQKSRPAGIKGIKSWFVTEKTATGKIVWKDLSGNNYELAVNKPDPQSINFHPAMKFDGTTFSSVLSNAQLKQLTVISAFYPAYNGLFPSSGNNNFFQLTYNDNSLYGLAFNQVSRNGLKLIDLNPNFGLPARGKDEAFRVASYYNYQLPSSTIWGEDNERKLEMKFSGYAPEMIIYSRVLTPEERSKVETYMAMKYGITQPVDYLSGTGKTLWSQSGNNGFNNRIVAIGKNEPEGLIQPRANTSYEEKNDAYTNRSDDLDRIDWEKQRSLTIGFEDPKMTGLKDGQFILWGDNNMGKEPAILMNDQAHFPGLTRMSREWKLMNGSKIESPTKIQLSGDLLERSHKQFDNSTVYFLVQTNPDMSSILKIYPMNDTLAIYVQPDNVPEESSEIVFKNFALVTWNNITWTPDDKGACYFTIAKAPILKIESNEMVEPIPGGNTRSADIMVSGGFPGYKYKLRREGMAGTVEGNFDPQGRTRLTGLIVNGKYSLQVFDTNITDNARTQKVVQSFEVKNNKIKILE